MPRDPRPHEEKNVGPSIARGEENIGTPRPFVFRASRRSRNSVPSRGARRIAVCCTTLALLASTASCRNYVEPTTGKLARLVVTREVKSSVQVYIYDDPKDCARFAILPPAGAGIPIEIVNIRAENTLAIKAAWAKRGMRGALMRCDIVMALWPVEGHSYELDLSSADGDQCSLNLVEANDGRRRSAGDRVSSPCPRNEW